MKKKSIIILLVLCFFVGSAVRIYQVNQNPPIPEKIYFPVNESVEFGEDYHVSASEKIDGYAIRVLGSELVEKERFYEKYQITDVVGESVDSEWIGYYYVVNAIVSNSKNVEEGKGFIPFNYPLVGKNYLIYANMSMYELINPNLPGGGFSLNPGEEVEVLIPYAIYPESVVEYKKNLEKSFEENPPHIQITAYPTKKLVATK